MSYSFSTSGKTKAEALDNAKIELQKITAAQPAHKIDQQQTEAALACAIDLLADSPSEPVSMSVSGAVRQGPDGSVRGINLSINVYLG